MSDRVPVYYPPLEAVHQDALGRGHNSAKEVSATLPYEAIYSVQDYDHLHKGEQLDGICVPDAPLPYSTKKGTTNIVASENVPLIHLPFQDDEMFAWLHFYPTEDSFEKKYCSDQSFGHAQDATSSQYRSGGWKQSEHLQSHGSQPHKDVQSTVERATFSRESGCDLRQISAPHTSRVVTDSPCRRETSISRALSGPSVLEQNDSRCVLEPRVSQTLSTPSVSEQYDSQELFGSQKNAINFSIFSRPVAAARSSLKMLASSSNIDQGNEVLTKIGNERQASVEDPESFGSSAVGKLKIGNERQASVEDPESFGSSAVGKLSEPLGCQGLASFVESITSLSRLNSSAESKSNPKLKDLRKSNTGIGSKDKSTSPTCVIRTDRNSDMEKLEVNQLKETIPIAATSDTQEMVTIVTSTSGNNSNEKSAKEMAISSCKTKSRHAEDFECDSKDVEENGTKEKLQLGGKRARAAEVHNQSERRRRNKINDRMKALQELIPHSNKSDKASMLDEAIEYIKTLQTQLQWMCMRSGVAVPPSMIPSNVQYPMVQQLNMGLGYGFGTTVVGNMLDIYNMSAPVPLPSFVGQPVSGPVSHLPVFQPSLLTSATYDPQGHMHVQMHQNLLSNPKLEQSSLNVQPSTELHKTVMQCHSAHQSSTHNEPK